MFDSLNELFCLLRAQLIQPAEEFVRLVGIPCSNEVAASATCGAGELQRACVAGAARILLAGRRSLEAFAVHHVSFQEEGMMPIVIADESLAWVEFA